MADTINTFGLQDRYNAGSSPEVARIITDWGDKDFMTEENEQQQLFNAIDLLPIEE